MTTQQAILEHHAIAASHHQEAARFHRQASNHFESGEDPEYWAHQALLAHEHTLRAIESGNAARQFCASQKSRMPAQYSGTVIQFPSNAWKTVESTGTILDGFQRHAVAADHHEKAAQHYDQASKHCLAGNYSPALREGQLASHHAQKALFQSNEAATQHVETYFDFLLPSLLAAE